MANTIVARLGRAVGHVVFRIRDILAPLAVVALIASARKGDFLTSPASDHWYDALGAFAVVVGLTVRFMVLATSGIRRSGVHRRVAVPTLYDTGPYAWCRNPLYVGNAMILVGLCFIFDSRWMVGIALPVALLAIRSIVAAEERVLAKDFGARYAEYCHRVPRFVPRAPARRTAIVVDWQRGLRKEHGPMFAAVSTALLLAATEDVARLGTSNQLHREAGLIGAWVTAAALWVIIRHLKHTGRLESAPLSSVPPDVSDHHPGDVAA